MDFNIFSSPENYICEIVNNVRVPEQKRKVFSGKTMAFLFLTKFCDVECSHCFFKSRRNIGNEKSIEYELTEDGLDKVINFINESNNGYLSVLGGGEPFNRFDYIIELIKRIKTDRLVLVTSGNWAQEYDKALEKILKIKEELEKRNDSLKVVLRISIDKWHVLKIGGNSLHNVIDIMKKLSTDNFSMEIHTLAGDTILEEVLGDYSKFEVLDYELYKSDNEEILKVSHARARIRLEDGFEIPMSVAQKFNSNLKVNLKNKSNNFNDVISYFDQDIEVNCFDNPSLVTNSGGIKGLDFLISYNGNVSTWGNEQPYDLNNLYMHTYSDVMRRSFDNIISYSFIDKGYKYRESIFNEVNPTAVMKSKAINIRDYAGASLFEEYSSLLYYAVRVIKDYLDERILDLADLQDLSNELKIVLSMGIDEIIGLYDRAEYTIIDQYKKEERTEVEWRDLFELINLGHYDVTQESIEDGINYFNNTFNKEIKDIDEIKNIGEEQYARLLNRLSAMKKEALTC